MKTFELSKLEEPDKQWTVQTMVSTYKRLHFTSHFFRCVEIVYAVKSDFCVKMQESISKEKMSLDLLYYTLAEESVKIFSL